MCGHWKSWFSTHFHSGKMRNYRFHWIIIQSWLAQRIANLMKFLLMRIRLLLTHKQGEDINNKGYLAANKGQR